MDQAYAAVLAPVWAKESGAGVEALGWLFAAFSAASVIGALVAARWAERLRAFACTSSPFSSPALRATS